MDKINLLPKGIPYYKANLHCHTTCSDGEFTPEEVKKVYLEKGYQVVAFTDHRKYENHKELNDEKFLAVVGMEVDIEDFQPEDGNDSRMKNYHINFYDTDPSDKIGEKTEIKQPLRRYHDKQYLNGYIEQMKEMGFLACYNHPYWSLQTWEDYKELKGLWGMEIYNHGCEMDGMYGHHPQVYEEMLRGGQRLCCVATDDNHNRAPLDKGYNDSFGGYVMIGAKEFSYKGIMEALAAGNFYSSIDQSGQGQGPEIYEMSLRENNLYVRCSSASKIYLQNMGRDCHRAVAEPGKSITEAVFKLNGNEGDIRLDVRDHQGRHAHSNAYFLDNIMK